MWRLLFKYPKLLSLIGVLITLGAVYMNWKSDIEDAVLATVRLKAMQEAERFKQERYQEAQRIIKDQAVRERSREIASYNMLQYIKENADEESCLVKPLSDNDVRLLRDSIDANKQGPSSGSNDK